MKSILKKLLNRENKFGFILLSFAILAVALIFLSLLSGGTTPDDIRLSSDPAINPNITRSLSNPDEYILEGDYTEEEFVEIQKNYDSEGTLIPSGTLIRTWISDQNSQVLYGDF